MDFDLTGLKPLDTSGLQPLDVTGLTPLGGGESFIQKAENFVGGLFGDKVSDKSLSGLITGDQTTPGPIGARRPVSSDNDASVFGKEAVKGLGSIGTSAIETPALLAYKKTASDFVTADKILRGDENMSPSNLGEQPPYLIGRDKDGRIQWTDTKTGEIGQLYGAAQKYFDEKDPEKRAEIRRQTLAAADPRNDPLYQKGKAGEAAMESALPTTQEEKGSWSGMFGQAAGSLIGFAAGGEGLAATKIPRALSIAGLGAVVEGSQDFNTAISKGADLDTAVDVGLAGMGIGTTEAIPIDHLLGRLDKLSGGRLRTAVVNAVKSAGEEGTQEALQQLLQNLVAKYGYNDSQQPTEGVGTNAAVGAGSGAAFSFLLTMILGKHAHSGPAPAEGETTNPASPTAGGRSAGGPASVTAPPPAQPASPEALAAAAASLTPEDHASPLPTDLIVTGKAVIADALAGKPRPDQAGAVPAETVGVPSPAAEEGGSGDLGSLLGAPPAQEANPINQLGDTVAPPVGVEYQPGQSGEEIGTSSSDINGLTSNSNAEEITPAPATEAASVVPAAGAAPAGDLDVSGLRPIDDSVGVTDSSASFSSVVPRGTIEDASQAGVENVRAVQGAENVASPVALPGVSEHAGPGALAAQRQPQPEATPQGQNAPAPRQVEIARRVTAYVAERSNSLIPQQVAAKLGITPQEATAALTTLANQRVIRRVGKAGRFMRHPTSGATGVLEFLAARGGVADNEGHDLKAGRNAQRNFPRYGPLIRKSGMSIDAAGEALHEAGYFGDPASTPRPTTAQVLDLIDGELAGKKTTALGDEGEAAARGEGDRARAAAEAEVERVIADRGLNTTDEERSAAVALMVSEGYDPLDALDHVLERAALQDDFVQLAADNERDRRHGFDALPPETQSDAAPGADEAASPPRGAPDELGAERPVGTPAPSGQSGQDHHGTVEQTDQGQQSVIPGAERISDRQHAERTIEAPLRAKAPQKAPDEGLFDTGSHRQTDLLDQGKLLRESERTPTTLSGKAPFGGTRPHGTGGPASDAQGQSNAAENSGAARTRPSPAEETPLARSRPSPKTGEPPANAQGQSSTENVSPGTEENKPTREKLGLSKKEPKLNKARQTGRAPAERTAAPNEREHLDQAALKVNGEVYTGPTHGDAYEAAINAGVPESEIDKVDQNGFVTSTGRYVGREEALKIASQSGKRYRRIGNAVTSQGTTAPTYEDLTGQRDRRPGLLPERPANPHFLENLEEIAADLGKRLSKLGIADKVALRLKDRINEAETADGRYARGLIEVALTAPDEQWVLNHESIHALRDLGVFRDAEWRALEKAARSDTARMKEIRQRYAGLDEDSLTEEAIADAYADWVKDKGETQGFLRMGFERIRNFFRALVQALRGGGFTTAEGVFGKIERGEVGRRRSAQQAGIGERAPQFHAAYHGSPHDFETGFSTDRIGSGEGAQSYGWGLYFAGAKKLGEFYRDKLSSRLLRERLAEIMYDTDDLSEVAATVAADDRFNESEKEFVKQLAANDWLGFDSPGEAVLAARRHLENFDPTPELVEATKNLKSGRLYHVELKPKEEDYLNLDETFHEQSPHVQMAIREVARRFTQDLYLDNMIHHGESMDVFRRRLEGHAGRQRASELLYEAGIPGNRYWDKRSRGRGDLILREKRDRNILGRKYNAALKAGEDVTQLRADFEKAMKKVKDTEKAFEGTLTSNYVIFDDQDVTITAKYNKRRDVSHQTRDESGQFTPMTEGARYALDRKMGGDASELTPRAKADLFEDSRDLLGGLGTANQSRIGQLLDSARTALQDRFLPLLRVQQQIEAETGEKIADELNAYVIEEGFSGRTADRLQQFELKFKRPLVEAIYKSGLSLERIQEYLYARHAKERNRAIAKINPELPDGGSGMTDAEATRILEEAKTDGAKAALDQIAKIHDSIHQESVRSRVADGLLSKETADKWKDIYLFYTPLRGRGDLADNAVANRPNVGRGYTVRGPESKRALGRKSKANDLLAYTLAQAEEAIIRGEKNRIGQALINLAKSAPDEDYWKVDKIDTKRRINDEGQVEDYSSVDRNDPNTLLVKIEGEQHRLWISDARLASSLKNLDADKVGFIIRALMKVNRFLSAVSTGFNPEFVISNMIRDLQAGTLNLAAQGTKKRVIAQILADYPKALKAGWGGVKGRDTTEWQQHFREYAAAGGKVDFWKPTQIQEHRANLERDLRLMNKGVAVGLEKVARGVLGIVNDANQAVDNAIRLATYVNLRKAGVSKLKAASVAKNLTINFNRRGELGPQMNALYLFFNASMQGSVVIAKIASTSRGRKVLAATIALGIISELLNGALSPPDPDDKESKYDKIPAFEKSRNLIVMLPEGWGADYLKLPLPYGFNAFFDMGRNIAAYARGAQKIAESLGNIGKTFADAFNPVGGTNSILNLLSPTVLDPFVDLAQNQNFAGKPIMPEQDPFGTPKPDSQLYWGSVTPVSREVAQKLNAITGGDEFKPGAIDVSPESIDYWSAFVGGGLGSFIFRAASDVNKLTSGAPLTINDVPIVRRIAGQKSPDSDISLFYDRADELAAIEQERKGLAKEGRIAEAKKVRLDNAEALSVLHAAEHTRDVLSRLRKAKLAAQNDEGMDAKALQARLDEIDQKRRAAVAKFNALYVEKVLKPQQKKAALIPGN